MILGRSTPGCHEIRLTSARLLPTTSLRLAIRKRALRRGESPLSPVGRQGRQGHGNIAAGDFGIHFHLRHPRQIIANFLYKLHAKFLVCHFAAAKLQLHPHLISPIQEFFAVSDFRQIIVIVDVNAKLDFLQPRAGRLFILGMLGNIIPKLSKIDDLAHRWRRGWGDFHQIEAKTLGPA